MGRSARCLLTGHAWCAGILLLLGPAVAGAAAGAAGAAEPARGAGVPPRLAVTASNSETIRFGVSDLRPQWRELPAGDGGPSRWSLSIDGFVSGGAPGAPRAPASGAWLVVPPGTRPELHVVAEAWQPAGDRPLAIETMPVIVPGSGDQPSSLVETQVLPGRPLPAGVEPVPGLAGGFAAQAGPAVTVGEPVWWRGRRIASCRLVPVRYDAQGLAGETLVSGQWEIRFVPDKAAAALPPAPNAKMDDGARDSRFAGAFLNGELLRTLPTEARAGTVQDDRAAVEAAPLAPRPGKAMGLLGAEARLAVSRTGPVRVSYARLRQRGLIPDVPIAESQLRLYQRRYLERADTGTGAPYVEIEVPLHMVGEGDAFDGDDFFVFYGLRLRDDGSYQGDLGAGPETVPGCGDAWEMNNEANLYWLACAEPPSGQSWARMATGSLAPSTGTPLANFRHWAHLEEQSAFRENLPTTTTDRLYLNVMTDTESSLAVSPFWKPDPAGAGVDLRVAIAGFNSVPHPVRFDLVTDANVTPLEEYSVATAEQVIRTYTLPASAIDGATTKVLMSRGVGATPFLFVFFNWFEIAYDALFTATGNELRFNGGVGAGARPLEVTGFTSADIGLLETTDPRAPVHVALQAGNVVADGATWKLSVLPDQAGTTREFHALGDFRTTGVAEFNYLKSSVAADPVDPTALAGGAPDLIVVTHPTFRAALDRWVQHRIARSGGTLAVHVVEVDDLYDWYSGGLRDPWAIKRFCNHALTEWESWSLVVVGDANENSLGKRVLSQAESWARDWVPTHYHTQRALSYEPELMASDKWYAALRYGADYPVEDFPKPTTAPFDMLSGRLPCNSVGELDLLIDKIIALETPRADQDDWRRRGFFIADDEWSNGYGAEALTNLVYQYGEADFLESERDSLATDWASGTGVPLEASLVSLKAMLDPQFPYSGPPPTPADRALNTVRQYTAAAATPALLSALNRGGIFASYQGHANMYVLSSEFWMQDNPTIPTTRSDTALLANTGRPWFFIGLGCHIADWAQNPVRNSQVPHERSLGEKLLLRPAAGASGVYASSGYEFITANRVFGEYISRRWTGRPPATRTVGPGASVAGRSRWVLGELLWASEADLMAVRGLSYPYGEMLAQYVLLGDPLMTIDGGSPLVEATLHGDGDQLVSGAVELAALDATNIRTLTIDARDEAGIDRLEVVDDQGNDLTSQVAVETLPAGAQTHQRVEYALTVPVQPYDHALTVRVYDTGAALPSDRHWELQLDMPQTAVFVVDGQELDPNTFVFVPGVPAAFTGTVTTAAWLDAETTALTLTSETLILSGVDFNVNKGRGLTVDFTAVAEADGSADGHSVVLGIDGHETELVLQSAPDAGSVAVIGRVLNFPNPMGEDTRFLIEANVTGSGRINLWSVAGSPVAHIAFTADGDPVAWDGRDRSGDELANGTYLYRVEIDGPHGTVRSDMQRLVIMR